jgi:hypothetical protein
VLGDDLITEELRRAGEGLGGQRLIRRQLQPELVTQECRQAVSDLLGFGLRLGEPEQMVVGLLPDIT